MKDLKYAREIPADVHRYVKEGIEAGMPEDKAWAVAWSRFCAYKSPGHDSCSGGPGDYFPGRKASSQTVASRYLDATTEGVKIPAPTKKRVNMTLIRMGMDGKGRFSRVGDALNDIGTVLAENGIEWGEVLNAHSFSAPRGRVNIDLAITNSKDMFAPTPVTNAMVAIHWTVIGEDEKGFPTYEIVAYVS